MSRGLGKAQVELLRIIDQRDGQQLDTFELASLLHHPDPALSHAKIKGTHRALRGLLKRGKIDECDHNSLGRMRWAKLGSRDRAIEAHLATQDPALAKWLRWRLDNIKKQKQEGAAK